MKEIFKKFALMGLIGFLVAYFGFFLTAFPVSAQSTAFNKPIAMKVNDYQSLRSQLAGKGPFTIYGWVSGNPLTDMGSVRSKFSDQVSKLNGISDHGGEKGIIFASYRSLEEAMSGIEVSGLGNCGADCLRNTVGVAWVGINTESEIGCPSDEENSIWDSGSGNAIVIFSGIASAHGFGSFWAPRRYPDSYFTSASQAINNMADAGLTSIGLQEQRVMGSACLNTRISAVNGTIDTLRGIVGSSRMFEIGIQTMATGSGVGCASFDDYNRNHAECNFSYSYQYQACDTLIDAVAGSIGWVGIWTGEVNPVPGLVDVYRAGSGGAPTSTPRPTNTIGPSPTSRPTATPTQPGQPTPTPTRPVATNTPGPVKDADLNNDGRVNAEDILQLLASWGPISSTRAEDIDSNSVANGIDAGIILANWSEAGTGPTNTPRPTQPPATPTPIGPTPTPRPTSSPGSGPSVAIHAQHYDSFKGKLKAGDQVISGVNRSDPDASIAGIFNDRLNALNVIDENEIGVVKNFMFSSYRDCQDYIGQIPADVAIISYNNESSMTPADERGDGVVDAVDKFASCVHGAGKKFCFIPVRAMWTGWSASELNSILDDVDSFDYQGQNEISSGVQQFVNAVTTVYNRTRGLDGYGINSNHNFDMYVQVWVSRSDNRQEDIVAGYNAVADLIDSAWIVGAKPMYKGPPDDSSLNQTNYILDHLNWR